MKCNILNSTNSNYDINQAHNKFISSDVAINFLINKGISVDKNELKEYGFDDKFNFKDPITGTMS